MEATEPSLPLEPREEAQVNWADLNVDLLRAIARRLHDIFDFVYFRTVCKNWSTATSISDQPSQVPWLLENGDGVEGGNSECLRFYSLFSDAVRTIHCPMAHGKFLHGPSHGYLYATNPCLEVPTHSLLNPLTKDEVAIIPMRYFRPFLACMGPDPIGNGDYLAFMDDDFSLTMGFYQPHNWDWDYLELPCRNYNLEQACLNGRLYINEGETGATRVVNLAGDFSFVIPPPKTHESSDHVYFVESVGKILRIVKDLSSAVSTSKFCFTIYQLDVDRKNNRLRWVETNSIGNQVLFLDRRGGISFTASPSTGLRGNCVYFLQSSYDGIAKLGSELYKYNMEDGQTENIPCPFKSVSTWLVPNVVTSLPTGHY